MDTARSDSGSPGTCERRWVLHTDEEGKPYFFVESLGGFSTWTRHLDLPPGVSPEDATDTQLWLALADRQIREVFKLCSTCGSPREYFSNPFFICGTCLKHCHNNCSAPCTMVVDATLWNTYGPYIRSCHVCLEQAAPKNDYVPGGPTEDQLSAQGALNRLKSVYLPHSTRYKLQQIEDQLGSMQDAVALKCIASVVRDHYCPGESWKYFELRKSPKGGNGIFATQFVPALTRVGIYPGYPDPLSADQCERSRPSPKYALAEFNAADYYNHPFPELMGTITPFINEPSPGEGSNTAWLQETCDVIEHGRLSVVTVRDIQEGEEITLSYGPLYPRDYPYAYDAYSFHPAETEDGRESTDTYVLWYYSSRDSEAEHQGWITYSKPDGKFYWLREDSMPSVKR